MTPLKKEFKSGGFNFKYITREGRIAVYSKAKGEYLGYEVIRVQFRPSSIFKGRQMEAREAFPPSESWGVAGWTCDTKERAFQKMDELLAKPPKTKGTP